MVLITINHFGEINCEWKICLTGRQLAFSGGDDDITKVGGNRRDTSESTENTTHGELGEV